LNRFPSGTTVDNETLIKAGLLPKFSRKPLVKVVLKGKLEKKLKVTFPASKKAKSLIEKTGGKIVNENPA
jgi:ribosomal protein L15